MQQCVKPEEILAEAAAIQVGLQCLAHYMRVLEFFLFGAPYWDGQWGLSCLRGLECHRCRKKAAVRHSFFSKVLRAGQSSPVLPPVRSFLSGFSRRGR